MALLSLRKASDSTSFVIEERDIIVGYDSTNGTKIEYVNNQSGRRDSVEVSDTTASITEVSESLILLSFADYPNDYGFINIDRIYSINDNASTQAVIIYDRGTTQKGKYVMSESRTEVLTAMYEKQGNYTYEVDDYNALTIRLKAAAGDVTAKFVSGDVITVYGALDGNNDTYVVDTVSFGGGKTTVTLVAGVDDDTDTTGRIMVKSLSKAELEDEIQSITDGDYTFNTVLLGDGAVGTPALQVGSTNKGLYEVSTNQLGVSVTGALATLFDTSGVMSDSFRPRVAQGTTPVGTVAITEYGDGKDFTTVLTLTNFVVGALAGAAANLGVGNIVYTYPAGQHLELVSSFSSLVLTAAGTAVATDTGLGSVIASGAVAVLSGTGTFEDRLTGQTITTDAVGGAAASALAAATAGIGTGISLNVAGSVKNVFLNSAGAWNVDNTGNLTASGTIILKWTKMS